MKTTSTTTRKAAIETASQSRGQERGQSCPHGSVCGTSELADKAVRAPVAAKPTRFWQVVGIVLLAEGAAILAFCGLEWGWLRQLHVLWLQTTLQALGCHVETAGTLLTIEGQRFQIDPDCTYVDLILCGLPLLWRVHRRWSANLAVLAGFVGAVVVVNLARVLYGVYALAHGVSLFWAHDLVDYVLWYPTLGVIAWLWAQSLKTLWSEPNESVSGSTGLWPVPPDDLPGGMADVLPANCDVRSHLNRSALPVGGSPTGTGESPVLPIFLNGSGNKEATRP